MQQHTGDCGEARVSQKKHALFYAVQLSPSKNNDNFRFRKNSECEPTVPSVISFVHNINL